MVSWSELCELVGGAWPGRNNKQRTPVGLAYMAADAVLQARSGDEVKEAYTRFKVAKDELPALIPGAVWPGTGGVHDTSKGKAHTLSGYMVLDFDHPDKDKPKVGELVDVVKVTTWVDKLMAKAKASPHTLVAYRSPSRMGVKVLVRLTGHPTTHQLIHGTTDKGDALHVRRSYYATYTNAAALLGVGDDVAIDANAKEPERLTYLAHDANAYFNAEAVPVQWVEAEATNELVFPSLPTERPRFQTDLETAVARIVKWGRAKYPMVPGKMNANAFVWACAFVRNDIDDTTANAVLADELGANNLSKLHIYMRDAHEHVRAGSDPWAWRGRSEPELSAPSMPIPDGQVATTGLRRWSREELHNAARTLPRPVLTGINQLDVSLGIRPGGVVLIGAEPGAGKSMFLVNLLLSMVGRNPDRSFVFYSAEMPAHECMARMVQALAPDPHRNAVTLRAGNVAYLDHDHQLVGVTKPHLLEHGIEPERGHLVRNTAELLNEMHRQAADAGVELGELFTGPSFQHLVEGQRIFDELCEVGRIIIADDERQLIKLADLRGDLEEATPLDLGAVFVDYATRIEGDDTDGKEMRHAVVDTSKQLTAITKARQVPLFLASQIGRDAFKKDAAGSTSAKRERELRAERPTNHFDALAMREMAVADGDVFAESAQWYRDADIALVLHNPAQGANRAPRRNLEAYTDGTTPFFVRVGKVRGGASIHDVVELGVQLHRQRIVSECPLPNSANWSTSTGRWYTKQEQDEHIERDDKKNDTPKPEGRKKPSPTPAPL